MMEQEWLAWWAAPTRMLEHLRGKASDRKLRLFAVACCRGHRGRLHDERSRRAVLVAERFADRTASLAELKAARVEAWEAARELRTPETWAAAEAADLDARFAAHTAAGQTGWARQRHLLHDLFGNPFRPSRLAPLWLRWNGGTVVAMARGIYEGHAFEDLPFLADALEEAGCTDERILAHCRSRREHVRGCWVLDLLRGKG